MASLGVDKKIIGKIINTSMFLQIHILILKQYNIVLYKAKD